MDARMQFLNDLLGKTVHVVIDRPIGYHHGDIVYPINYGYIPDLMGGDGEEQDAYVLGVDVPLSSFDGWVVGAIHRKNDCEDKLVVAPKGTVFHQGQITEAVHFQEQYFDTYVISLFRKSCGVLPYRVMDGNKEYLIVFEQFSKCWSLPKGHMEPGETEIETALRELWEETGLTAELDPDVTASIAYPISASVRKQVVFFRGEVSGKLFPRPGEIADYKWVTEKDLWNYLFPSTVVALQKLLNT